MFLEIHADTRRKTPYVYGLFRETFRQDGRVRHRTRGRVTGLTLAQLQALREFLKQGCPRGGIPALPGTASREYGAAAAVLQVAKALGLERLLYSRREAWVCYVLAMIVGRVVYQGSKLSLTQRWRDTGLWPLCGVEENPPDVDAAYAALDRLVARQPAIQRALARRHLGEGCVVLYDVTSSYFEGEHRGSALVDFGHNRDGKRGHKQVVIGLLADPRGCPVGVSVYRGNTSDQKTLADRVTELKEEYGLRDMVMVGDRGMLTSARLAELSAAGLRSVTALTHPQMLQLMQRRVIQPSLFDEREIAEIYDPETPALRYLLCRNPVTAAQEGETRRALLAKTREELQRIAAGRRKSRDAAVGAAVGKVLAHWKMGKFITWSVREGRLAWQVDEARVSQEEALDGCYVIRTDVAAPEMDKNQAVACYRSLARVERAFRSLKTVRLEIRPTYHHLDRRIEAHVFLCMLAYYVEWHMRQRLAPLFEADGQGKDRRWTFAGVLERLKSIREETGVLQGHEVSWITTPDEEQRQILDLLEVQW